MRGIGQELPFAEKRRPVPSSRVSLAGFVSFNRIHFPGKREQFDIETGLCKVISGVGLRFGD